ELFSYFLDQLATEDSETTIFISDRPGIGVQPLLAMHAAAKKFVYIPINHVLTPDKPRQGELDGFIQPVLQHPQKVDGL
ncbi:poly(glycerol-phosphate) alpha-glucosyltransferase, partial [Lacticaseibacillus paracasei]